MIKVIRHGDKKRIVCPTCSCIFTYEKDDVTKIDFGKQEVQYRVICPDCGESCHADLLGV